MHGKVQESGLTEIMPLICTSAIWDSILCFLILSFLKLHCWMWLHSDDCWMQAEWGRGDVSCFHPEFLRAQHQGDCSITPAAPFTALTQQIASLVHMMVSSIEWLGKFYFA